MRGEMMVTFMLMDMGVGTDVLAEHDNVPPAISPADNEAGWREALDKLVVFVEAGQSPYALEAMSLVMPDNENELRVCPPFA
jgi:hypothetical protein